MKLNSPQVGHNMGTTRFQRGKIKCCRIWSTVSSIRFLISTITTMLFINGLLLLTVGVLAIVMCGRYDQFVANSYFVLPKFAIATAVVIFLTAILGLYGAKSEKYHFVVAYVALLVTILIFAILITVIGIQLEDDIFHKTGDVNYDMYASLTAYSNNYYYRKAWQLDDLQREHQCCGVFGVSDWGANIPVSCCTPPDGALSPFACTSRNAHHYGCRDVLNWYLAGYAYATGVTAAVVTCLQGISIVVAAWIAYKVKYLQGKQYDESEFKNGAEHKGLLHSPMDKASKAAVGVDFSQYHTIPGQSISGSGTNSTTNYQ